MEGHGAQGAAPAALGSTAVNMEGPTWNSHHDTRTIKFIPDTTTREFTHHHRSPRGCHSAMKPCLADRRRPVQYSEMMILDEQLAERWAFYFSFLYYIRHASDLGVFFFLDCISGEMEILWRLHFCFLLSRNGVHAYAELPNTATHACFFLFELVLVKFFFFVYICRERPMEGQ